MEYKYKTVGKLYKQSNEVDSQYDYYLVDASNTGGKMDIMTQQHLVNRNKYKYIDSISR